MKKIRLSILYSTLGLVISSCGIQESHNQYINDTTSNVNTFQATKQETFEKNLQLDSDTKSNKRGTPSSYPSWIPLDNNRRPASDLVYQGSQISTERAAQLRRQGVNLTDLDPNSDSDLWSKSKPFPKDPILFRDGEKVSYINAIDSQVGKFRFIANTQKRERIEFVAAVDAHKILLRAKLLEKLGYNVPTIMHVKNVEVSFSNQRQAELFEDDFEGSTTKSIKRWLIKKNSKSFVLQDLVAYKANLDFYNLAIGTVPVSVVKNRRIIRSLIVPLALSNFGESINMVGWKAGRTINNHVALNLPEAQNFEADLDDARWILKRMQNWTRSDFAEIVASGKYPLPVEKLLIEKMLSRRNSLYDLFKMNVRNLDYDTKVSFGRELKNGKLLKEKWEGFAARFAYGDPENPLSGPELAAYFKSTIISNLISNLVSRVNDELLETDYNSELLDQRIERIQDNFKHFLKTGEVREEPVGLSVAPFFDGDLILSRDIVTGSYLGTDNLIQLADTVGFNIATGAIGRVDGLATNVFAGGNVKAFYRRTLTHLKPVKSIRAAVKYPFKNMIVPVFTNQLVQYLNEIMSPDLATANDSERKKQIRAVVDKLKQNLEIGESIIVTDSVGGGFGAYIGARFYAPLEAIASINTQKLVVGRLHIHRKDKDTLQVYNGKGDVFSITFSAGLNLAKVPLLTISVTKRTGKAKTEVYSLNLNPDERRNSKIIDNLKAIRSLLRSGSMELVKEVSKPFTIEHKFNETLAKVKILFLRWAHFNGNSEIKVTNPKGQSKHYLRRITAERDGKNWQQFTFDVVNSLISELTDISINLGAASSGDPGETVGGTSRLRQVVYEGELHNGRTNVLPKESFIELQYRYKGWSLNRGGLENLVEKINSKYDFDFIPDEALGTTEKIKLYRADLKIFLYEEALNQIVRWSRADLMELFSNYIDKPEDNNCEKYQGSQREKKICFRIRAFFAARGKFSRAKIDKDAKKYADSAIQMVNAIEALLSGEDFIDLIGGKQNLYATARLSGFREGDENGDQTYVSSSIGEFGSNNIAGPLAKMINDINVTRGEFYALWLRSRL